MTLPPALLAELAHLNDAQIADLLGHIVDPPHGSPVDASDALVDAMAPVRQAYLAAYPLVGEEL